MSFAKNVWERLEQYVDRFRHGLAHELANQQSSRSFSRDNKGAIYEFKLVKHTQKTNDDVEKSKNRRKQNLEDETNNVQLDKEDTQRSNLNSKHLSVTLCVKKQPDSFICFYLAAGKCEFNAVRRSIGISAQIEHSQQVRMEISEEKRKEFLTAGYKEFFFGKPCP